MLRALYSAIRALEALTSTITQYYRINIQDGRVFIGIFTCMDKDKNIILTNTEEYHLEKSAMYTKGSSWSFVCFPANSDFIFWPLGRYVGMVMIPWRYVVKVEVEMID
jgi:small nuclear ribonucleoprotein (snRNP)-like protein